jgi:hypothetical protein
MRLSTVKYEFILNWRVKLLKLRFNFLSLLKKEVHFALPEIIKLEFGIVAIEIIISVPTFFATLKE